MKLVKTTPTGYMFATSSGTTWTREKLKYANKSVEIRGWTDTRELFLPDSSDADLFPNATWRLSLTPNRAQDDPLFVSVPVRIKPGYKEMFEIFGHDGTVETTVRAKRIFNW